MRRNANFRRLHARNENRRVRRLAVRRVDRRRRNRRDSTGHSTTMVSVLTEVSIGRAYGR